MEPDSFLSFVVALCVGRLCLSLIPPGWPGDHNRLELGATLCASWLLGSAAWTLVPWYWPWALALGLRLLLLPAGMRPRHERERGARPLWYLVFLLCCAGQWIGGMGMQLAIGACGALFAFCGWRTWQRRADRRARGLALCGLLAPLIYLLVHE